MDINIMLDSVYGPSEEVVAREIEGELIIVPLTAGIGNMEDEIYTLNESGRAIWRKLDGTKSVKTVVEELSSEFEANAGEIEKDVTGLIKELVQRRMLFEIRNG